MPWPINPAPATKARSIGMGCRVPRAGPAVPPKRSEATGRAGPRREERGPATA